MKRIVIAGGSGFLGSALAKYFAAQPVEVVILSRKPSTKNGVTEVYWDGETEGDWCRTLEGTEALINLSGKSVDCRYSEENKKLIYDSRLKSTHVLGTA